MKIIWIFIFISICSAQAKSSSSNSKRKENKKIMSERWYRLNKLIHDEIITIKSVGKLGPKLTYRLMELYSEKLKLLKEKENKIFLNSFSENGKIRPKSEYFKESKKLYEYTHNLGKHLVTQYPNFIHKGDIFYTMALNAREYSDGKWTENYLLRALKNTPQNSKNEYNIKTNLAEYYYNEKKYEKAIFFYKDILKTSGNEWHSKHLYNAAWSYLKLKMYNEAIVHLHQSYKFSKLKGHLSVEDQVLNSIGIFYVYSNDINSGIDFYIKNVEKPANYLITMANKSAEKLSQEKAEIIFKNALRNSQTKKQLEEELLVRTALLDHYRTFKKYNQFYDDAIRIYQINKKQKIPNDYLVSSIEKIKSLVGYLQVRLSNNMKKILSITTPSNFNKSYSFLTFCLDLTLKIPMSIIFFKVKPIFQ